MITLNKYENLICLYESDKTIIYRGVNQENQTSVIIKTLKSDYPTSTDVAKLKHEYEILQKLNISGVVKAYHLETYKNKPILVIEDIGGKDLSQIIYEHTLNLQQCLKIAIEVARTIGQLHQQQIIHKDIKPQNIIINLETDEVKLIDFSLSSQLSKENPTLNSPNLLEGTLAYISPEQTGRMNRSIDYRTDFYSFGVTLYEMLTGTLPFQSNDPMELIHSHIAKKPPSLHDVKPEIPESISVLVLKLLAKTAEERYQSAYGIKADLKACYEILINKGKIEDFIPGQKDLSAKFEIPQKLYGRENEVEKLMNAFARVAEGKTEMMLVAGYSGIGKSALVNEVHKPIVKERGYFISGKFDQFKRNIPYACLIQAFRELSRQLLTETEEKIKSWGEKLLSALGTNGQVIVDVIPEIELIIGKQQPVPQLPPSESQNRFNLVFKNFIHVFTQKQHPLVMFLDDLQWADSASLKLIELLITDAEGQYLLMIGAYRDNEVNPTHPLILMLDDIGKTGRTINTITLKNLGLENVNQLICESLRCSDEKAELLANLIQEKTAGNPFFLTQLLRYLYLEGFVKFDFNSGVWNWDITEIQKIAITDNVVELMISKIQKLSPQTQNILKLAACVGNTFDLYVLSIVNQQSQAATAAELWEALQGGLILPLSESYKIPQLLEEFEELTVNYKFLHDRVQQAAYALIPEEDKQQVHLKVGQLLLRNTNPSTLEENIFDIVNQLNIGVNLIKEQTEKDELAQLNLVAGKKAKSATAYEAALKYLTAGIRLLNNNSWETDYNLTLDLYVQTVEVQYLNTNFAASQKLSEVILDKAENLLDKVKIYELKIQFYLAQNKMLEAIDTALPVLELLGYPLSLNPENLTLIKELPSLSELESLPEMTDLRQLAVLQILTIITGPSYQSKPELLPFIVFKMVNLCLRFGYSSLAAYAYGMYGLMLCGPLGDIPTGYHAGKISLEILEQYPSSELKCKIYMLFNSFVGHWKEPHKDTIGAFVETISMGLETGDMVYLTYCCMWSCGYLMLTGDTLNVVEEKQKQYVDLLANLQQYHGLYPAKTWRQLTLNLRNKNVDKYVLDGESFNQNDLENVEASKNQMLLFFVYFAKLILAYIMRDYESAFINLKIADQYQGAAVSSMLSGGYAYYACLVCLAYYGQTDEETKLMLLERVEKNHAQIKVWAENAAMNYQSKYALITAEKARVLGDIAGAMEHYDRAIALAQENGFIQEEALACELAGYFYQSIGKTLFAQIYLVDARYDYVRWGALGKVQELEVKFPELVITTSPAIARKTTITSSGSTSSNTGEVLDLSTVMKASQVIAGEIVLDKLLAKLMKLIIENAGAQKGLLILNNQGEWKIEAIKEVGKEQINVLQSIIVNDSEYVPLSIIRYVERTQEDVVLVNANTSNLFNNDLYIVEKKPKSVICAPIINQGQILGVMYLENNLTPGAFTNDRLELLKIISGQTSMALENALLYRTLEAKVTERTAQLANANKEITVLNAKLKQDNLRMSAELDVAFKMQQMILPKVQELAAINHLDIAGFMQPADEVGGDYYDVLDCDGVVTIGIGDVTGHGLESGILMVMTQTAVRTLKESGERDCIRFLDILNRTIYKNIQRMNSDKNLTLALLNYAEGKISISGQHEEVLVVRSDGKIEVIDTGDLGFPIGLDAQIVDFIGQISIELNRGDGVVLYTDGITEAENLNNEYYGLAKLMSVVSENWQKSALEIQEEVIKDLRNHIGEQKVFDDITLLVLKQK